MNCYIFFFSNMANLEVWCPSTSHPYAYELISKISSSASSTVYKAKYLNTKVAIKIIHLEKPSSNFESVLRVARRISHENIPTTKCFFRSNDRIWVVLPFMYSLRSINYYLPHGLNEQQIAITLKPTLMALSFLHEWDKFHGNLKPSNILIESNGSIKVFDFGTSNSSSKYVKGKDLVPYWIALECDPLECNNDKAKVDDIWNFGIRTLESFHGGPPLTSLPKSVP